MSVLTKAGPVIVTAESVTKTFATPDGRALPVLDGVSFTLSEGEIVALLGKSGSGKSTLLRCVAGLIAPTAGTVTYRGTPLTGANPGVSMVFQTFALLPWLTVQQNVELGLEARSASATPRASRPSSTFCCTVSQGNSANVWNTIDTPGLAPVSGVPR